MREKKWNSTFMGSEPAWANACVGENGEPGYMDYAEGYSIGANHLIQVALADRGSLVDRLIYPICFNMRHSVEMRLKSAIIEVSKISRLKGEVFSHRLSRQHDINNLWNFLKEKAAELDGRYIEILLKSQSTIEDIGEIDSTGQTFRYPRDVSNRKHLVGQALINVLVLKKKFETLERNLDELHGMNHELQEEYRLGTFTRNLSRKDLFDIARELPPVCEWVKNEFAQIRDHIKKKYTISGTELSKAISIIKGHYEMYQQIGIEPLLIGLDEQFLLKFYEESVKFSPPKENQCQVFIDSPEHSIFDEIVEYSERSLECGQVFSGLVTPERVAGLNALYYLTPNPDYSEYYQSKYDLELRTLAVDENSLMESFMHIFTKKNARHRIISSLNFLGFTTLGQQLSSIS